MSQYIAYHVDLSGRNSAPVAAEDTEDACRMVAFAHIKILGCREGVLVVEQRDDLPEHAFNDLKQYIQTYFSPAAGSS